MHSLDSIINPKPYGKSKRPIKFGDDIKQKIWKLAEGEVPEGHKAWSLRLLAEKLVEMGIVDSISGMTVHRILKQRN